MISSSARPTRGTGLLEPFLAKLRMNRAERLITEEARGGRILDIGCGQSARFLAQTRFHEKYGIDQMELRHTPGIVLRTLKLDLHTELPFSDEHFQVVTLLAVVEHLPMSTVLAVLREAYRVLARQGRIILTTPAPWSDGLLRVMANLSLVSSEEIEEHVTVFRKKDLESHLAEAGFSRGQIRSGYFELGLNMWATGVK